MARCPPLVWLFRLAEDDPLFIIEQGRMAQTDEQADEARLARVRPWSKRGWPDSRTRLNAKRRSRPPSNASSRSSLAQN